MGKYIRVARWISKRMDTLTESAAIFMLLILLAKGMNLAHSSADYTLVEQRVPYDSTLWRVATPSHCSDETQRIDSDL